MAVYFGEGNQCLDHSWCPLPIKPLYKKKDNMASLFLAVACVIYYCLYQKNNKQTPSTDRGQQPPPPTFEFSLATHTGTHKPCDWRTYAVRHKDLMDPVRPSGMPTRYETHYLTHGKNEPHSIWDCSTYLNAQGSKDQKSEFGRDCNAAVKDYIQHGRNESWRNSHCGLRTIHMFHFQ